MSFTAGPVRGLESAPSAAASALCSSTSAVADLRAHWPLYHVALPAIVAILVFGYGPLFGLLIAFQNFSPVRGITGSPWAA